MKKFGFTAGVLLIVLCAGQVYAQSETDFETDGNGTITKYVGWDTAIVIPANIGGKPVRVIGDGAFSRFDLTSVTIPNTVKIIGESAFAYNKLTNVVIPEGVTSIGEYAFSGNPLARLTIPSSINSIGIWVFGDEVIPTVTLGANISGNLNGKVALNIYFDYISNGSKAGTYTYRQKDTSDWRERGGGRKRTEDGFEYVQTQYGIVITGYNGSGVNALRIPERVNSLPVRAILGLDVKGITRVLIPNSVTSIGNSAFSDNQLTSVTIPDGVTSIGDYAFSSNQLTSVIMPANVTLGSNSLPFVNLYNNNGKKAGTYTGSVNSSTWTYQP